MQIIIDIPENIYQAIIDSQIFMTGQRSGKTLLSILISGVKRGTPLPKGHGRLIILSEDRLKENQIDLDFSCQKWISEVGLSYATVAIIKADKETEE